jgi:hypothetical protein
MCWMDKFLDVCTVGFGIDEVRREKQSGCWPIWARKMSSSGKLCKKITGLFKGH